MGTWVNGEEQGGGGGSGDALTTNPLSQFAATTSAQLRGVISDETGTGAAVFATSPTLVTPILGTPTSGTLTNCTGLPTAGLVNNAVSNAKLATMAASRIKGQIVGGSGDPVDMTPAQSRAVIDQTVSATVTGAATTSFDVTGIPAATRYLAVAYIKQDAAGTPAFYMYMNGVTTGYTATVLALGTGAATPGSSTNPPTINSDGAGDYSIIHAIIENVNGRLQISALTNQTDRSSSQGTIYVGRSTETSLTSITMTSSVANLIAVGSYIEVYVLA